MAWICLGDPVIIEVLFRKAGSCRYMYFANSTTASVVCKAFSFLTRSIFRGGDGHCRESRSLPLVSASISFCIKIQGGGCTEIAGVYAVWEFGERSDD